MENTLRNEMIVELGSEKILLRPTFENLAAMESKLGSVAYLTFKFAKATQTKDGKPLEIDEMAKAFPTFSETTQIIYYNQVEKKFSLDEINTLVMKEGVKACAQAVQFLVRCTLGSTIKLSEKSKKKP